MFIIKNKSIFNIKLFLNERLEDEINEERRRWNLKLQNEINRMETLREKDKKFMKNKLVN